MSEESNTGHHEAQSYSLAVSDDSLVNDSSPTETENPIAMVRSRLYGRWKHLLITGIVLSLLGAWIGYSLASVTFKATSVLVVESSLPALVEETLETRGVAEFDAFVIEKSQQMRTNQVFLTAFEDPILSVWIPTCDNTWMLHKIQDDFGLRWCFCVVAPSPPVLVLEPHVSTSGPIAQLVEIASF